MDYQPGRRWRHGQGAAESDTVGFQGGYTRDVLGNVMAVHLLPLPCLALLPRRVSCQSVTDFPPFQHGSGVEA
jgi:hypothetical protein